MRVALSAAFLAVMAAIMGTVSLLPLSLRFSLLTRLGAMAAMLVVGAVHMRLHWRQLDEFQREGTKVAASSGLPGGINSGNHAPALKHER